MARTSATEAVAVARSAEDAVPQPVALLAAKLLPPELANAVVVRDRLLGQLSRAVHRSPLTLLSGPAGSGKTVLGASWREAEARSRAISWLTLDAYDNEPAVFWSYGVEANRHVLDTLCRYSHEQGLAMRRLSVDEMFAPSIYDLSRI